MNWNALVFNYLYTGWSYNNTMIWYNNSMILDGKVINISCDQNEQGIMVKAT